MRRNFALYLQVATASLPTPTDVQFSGTNKNMTAVKVLASGDIGLYAVSKVSIAPKMLT